jgi:hypothetical protein
MTCPPPQRIRESLSSFRDRALARQRGGHSDGPR